MSAGEIGSILVGLLLGYWAVSAVLLRGDPTEDAASELAPPTPEEPWHVVLKLRPDASLEDIEAAYGVLRQQYEPDSMHPMAPDLQDLARRRLDAIQRAHDQALSARR